MLKDLLLKHVYDSAEHDIVKDLFVPLLSKSIQYYRGVGFFTSGWLRVAAEGLANLIENGGKACIALSLHLEKNDWEAICQGQEAKDDEILKKILHDQVSNLKESLEKNTLNTLAWLIADDLLELRFAVPVNFGSDYHDKVAIFMDQSGDAVAIHGSFNDSIKGTLNGEAFSVFKSWESGQFEYVQEHKRRLLELWEHGNNKFRIYTIPKVIKESIVKLRNTDQRPYLKASGQEQSCAMIESIRLYDYQEKAIQFWENADHKCIFEMATGTGKTFTSLVAAMRLFNEQKKIILIIIVPYLHLLDQWAKNCEIFGLKPILCSGENKTWKYELLSQLQDLSIGIRDNSCIIVVNKTASMDKFARLLRHAKKEIIMLIADEVHGLGSVSNYKALIPDINARLGLSATPRRWFDELGTQRIFNYFNNNCFEFSLEQAIGKYLAPYEYHPITVSLIENEFSDYTDLSNRIQNLIKNKDIEIDSDLKEKLRIALIMRANIIAKAVNKKNILFTLLNKLKTDSIEELSHILIYCAPGTHKEILKAVSELGFRCREFVAEVPMDERQEIINLFTTGEIQIIVAIKCLDEGVDIPSITTAFLLASTSNPREFIQRRGRILRKTEQKKMAKIYDFIVVPNIT